MFLFDTQLLMFFHSGLLTAGKLLSPLCLSLYPPCSWYPDIESQLLGAGFCFLLFVEEQIESFVLVGKFATGCCGSLLYCL